MKIAILVPNYSEIDGSARIAEVQALELIQQGHEVEIFTLAADIKTKNVKVNIMGMPRNLLLQRIYRLFFPLDIVKTAIWLPKLKHFDQMIVHLYPFTYLGFLARKLYKTKYIFWYHGISDPQYFPNFHERLYLRLQILFTRLTVRNADKAVAVSKFGQSELKRYTGLDSDLQYNKVDLGKFRLGINGEEIRNKYGLNNDPVILFVGMLRPVKAVHMLIQSFNLLKRELPDAKLLIVGRPDYPYYFKKLKGMSNESVIFTGAVSHQYLPQYYACCDIYASCSLWEIHNVSVLEAQASGKPCVTFNIIPFQEEVNDQGSLVEVGNIEKFSQACLEKIKLARQEAI